MKPILSERLQVNWPNLLIQVKNYMYLLKSSYFETDNQLISRNTIFDALVASFLLKNICFMKLSQEAFSLMNHLYHYTVNTL